MSCCRSSKKYTPRQRNSGTVTICANCHASLRDQVKQQIDAVAQQQPRPGTYRVTVEVMCECGYRNKIPATFSKG